MLVLKIFKGGSEKRYVPKVNKTVKEVYNIHLE